MKNNFPHVFSPLTIRGMTLKNRVVMMPMGSDFAGHDGELSDEHIKYYELRARGGTGLIMVEKCLCKNIRKDQTERHSCVLTKTVTFHAFLH